jgi:pSer/pThr/pTyr-binding forkhead associated (FHA) protein
LKESEECFKKIRELDPENTISLEKLRGVRNIISDIKGKIGTSETEPEMPAVRISSGCMALQDMRKKIYLYSKDRITMGRDSKNDIVLRIIPYQPKEQYPENWQKSSQISSLHAEILNKTGQFFIRDIGGGNAGSANGTYLDGKRAKPMEAYPLKDNMRINIAKVLDLECIFLGEYSRKDKVKANVSTCVTVLGEVSDSCFGIDKMGAVDAIKIKRRNNFSDGEKYVIVIREVTVGRSKSNGISIDREKVSDIHARLFFRDNQYWLEDLNSRYGTWVNGKRINPGDEVSLGTNSEIVLGDAHIRFEGFK